MSLFRHRRRLHTHPEAGTRKRPCQRYRPRGVAEDNHERHRKPRPDRLAPVKHTFEFQCAVFHGAVRPGSEATQILAGQLLRQESLCPMPRMAPAGAYWLHSICHGLCLFSFANPRILAPTFVPPSQDSPTANVVVRVRALSTRPQVHGAQMREWRNWQTRRT